MKKVLIDPGHAPGNTNGGSQGYKEYEGMWKLSNFLVDALARCGVLAILSREYDENPAFWTRGERATGFDLFISEHSNAATGNVRGCECYYSVDRPNDKSNAAQLSAATAKLMDNNDRGAKTRKGDNGGDYYTVMQSAAAAGCAHVFLMESGFHDNVQDEAFLLQDDNLQKIAEIQAEWICGILGVTYMQQSPEDWRVSGREFVMQLGISDGTRPQDNVTREEMWAMLERSLKGLIS